MKTRLIIGIAAVLVLLGIAVLAYVLISANAPDGTVPTTPSGSDPFGSLTDGTSGAVTPTRLVPTREGKTVAVPDFTAGKSSVQIGDDAADVQYDLTPYPDYEPGKPYPTHAFDVQFNGIGSQFVVTLNEEPLGASRLAAEAFFRDTLELTDAQLCTLDILVGVPYSVNESFSGYQNLGLSFCPDAFRLP
jgi:hypothetical protein